jgi:signal transduction histidine kinase
MALQRRLLVAADEERRALARELHDETGQSPTALLVRLRTLEGVATLHEARRAARDLRELTSRTLDEVGRLARGLHPRVLDELGLVAAITRYIEEFADTHGIAVMFRKCGMNDGRELVPAAIATTLYRLLQESLTNVARHARARNVRIDLTARNGTVRLTLTDDGRGMDPEALRNSKGAGHAARGHLGLIGMQERTALFGGTLEICSTTGEGTTVAVEFPLGEPRRTDRGNGTGQRHG